jgi:hypothetical protein
VDSHQTYARRWLGHAFAYLARRLLDVPLSDFQCGAKALTADAWRAVRSHLYEAGFAWDLELIAVANALFVISCSTHIREHAQSLGMTLKMPLKLHTSSRTRIAG